MCPNFNLIEGICELADIEPSRIGCVGECACFCSAWDECRVYESQFVLHCEEYSDFGAPPEFVTEL
ncbi:MAG TPA: hypothetical protein VN260_03230 [Dissulfurispiraceae bacterium]|nr:hypothetical protein [Dissulfurispiraceae bacterium]